jgi:peptide/nickel transport system substrate-binding protein
MTRIRRAGAAIAAGTLVLAVAGCHGDGSPAASAGTASPGGTLNVLMNGTELASLDPATSNSQASQDISPLIISPLTIVQPDSSPSKIVGDLATDAGEPSDGARVWTFHIRPGMKYSNGQPITSYDVKYGVERSFASDLQGGPGYAQQFLADDASYQGPYVDKSGLSSIATPNSSTIVFHLNQPLYDFNFVTTTPGFSGVPQQDDTGVKYGSAPLASGPYEIASYQPGRQLILKRNPDWKSGEVPAIKAYPDEIDFELGLDGSVIDQRLIADEGADQDAMDLDTTVQASDVANVLANPRVKPRSITGSLGQNEWMLVMNTKQAPFNNLLVREAMEYAVDKQTFQTAAGGPLAGGPIATNLEGPGVLGYDASYDPYPGGATGDPAKAKQLLAQAGYPNGISTTLEFSNATASAVNEGLVMQTALARAGITVKLTPLSQSTFYADIANPSQVPPLEISAWGANWSDPSQILGVYQGNLMTATGPNQDASQLEVPSLDTLIEQANAAPSQSAAVPLWTAIDEKVMQQAPVVPLINFSDIYLHGSKVIGDNFDPSFGTPNLLTIAVAH